jgi:hypothetical protein
MADNKTYLTQFITDFKTRNSLRLSEMRTESPELLTAVEDILKYLGKRYGVEEEVVVVPEIIAPPVQTEPTASTNPIPLKNWEATFVLNGRNIVPKGNTWAELQKSFRDYMNDDVMGVLMRLTWEDDFKSDATLQNRDVFDTRNNELKGDVGQILKNIFDKNDPSFSKKYSFSDHLATKTVIPLQDWTLKKYDKDDDILASYTGNDWKSMNKTVYEEIENIDFYSIRLSVVWQDMTMVNSGKVSDIGYIDRLLNNAIVGTLSDVVREIFLREKNLNASNYSWDDNSIPASSTQPSVVGQTSSSAPITNKVIELRDWDFEIFDKGMNSLLLREGFDWESMNETVSQTPSKNNADSFELNVYWKDGTSIKSGLVSDKLMMTEYISAAITGKIADVVRRVFSLRTNLLPKNYSWEDAPKTSIQPALQPVTTPPSATTTTTGLIEMKYIIIKTTLKNNSQHSSSPIWSWNSLLNGIKNEIKKYTQKGISKIYLNIYWKNGEVDDIDLNPWSARQINGMTDEKLFVANMQTFWMSKQLVDKTGRMYQNYSWKDVSTTSVQPAPPIMVASNSAFITPPAPSKKVATGSIEIQFWEFEITDQTRGLLVADGVDWKSLNEAFFLNFHPIEFESLDIRISWENDGVFQTSVSYKEDEFDELLFYRNNINNWVLKNFEEVTGITSDDYQFQDEVKTSAPPVSSPAPQPPAAAKRGRPKKAATTTNKKKIEEVKSADDIVDLDIDDIEI